MVTVVCKARQNSIVETNSHVERSSIIISNKLTQRKIWASFKFVVKKSKASIPIINFIIRQTENLQTALGWKKI